MNTSITRYSRRNWAIYDPAGNLIAVTVYRKGATRVAELLAALPGSAAVGPLIPKPHLEKWGGFSTPTHQTPPPEENVEKPYLKN
jgi:YD repeat-containing protein